MSFFICIGSNNVYALSTDESKPVQITADNGVANLKSKDVTLNGPLTITRGSILVKANKGTVHQDANNDKLLTLYGTPVTFTQKQDDGSTVDGQCNQFEYNTKTNIAILTGRARMQKGKDSITGERITYNTKTSVYSAAGMPTNGVNKTQTGKVTIILDNLEKTK